MELLINLLFSPKVGINIFRSLPPNDRQNDYDPDEDEPLLEEAWPHMQVHIELAPHFFSHFSFLVGTCSSCTNFSCDFSNRPTFSRQSRRSI